MLFSTKFFSKIAIAVGLLFVAGIGVVNASELVFVESYGRNRCSPNVSEQEELSNLIETQENVILVNCKNSYYKKIENGEYESIACRKRLYMYKHKFKYSYTKSSMAVVNGLWDANPVDVVPAINLGRMDKISQLSLSLNGNDIDIKIPKIETEQKSGVIMLFSYFPVLGIENNDDRQTEIEIKNNLDRIIAEREGDDYVEKDYSNSFFRSVLTMEDLGEWNGEEMNLSYSLDQLVNDGGVSIEDLGYVAALFADEEGVGTVLAAGEIVSHKEQLVFLKSEPVDIGAAPFLEPVTLPVQ